MTDQELTDAVAENVMGWTLENVHLLDTWRPLEDRRHTQEVIDAMRANGWRYELYWKRGGSAPQFWRGGCLLDSIHCDYAGEQRAILEAALKAVEVQP